MRVFSFILIIQFIIATYLDILNSNRNITFKLPKYDELIYSDIFSTIMSNEKNINKLNSIIDCLFYNSKNIIKLHYLEFSDSMIKYFKNLSLKRKIKFNEFFSQRLFANTLLFSIMEDDLKNDIKKIYDLFYKKQEKISKFYNDININFEQLHIFNKLIVRICDKKINNMDFPESKNHEKRDLDFFEKTCSKCTIDSKNDHKCFYFEKNKNTENKTDLFIDFTDKNFIEIDIDHCENKTQNYLNFLKLQINNVVEKENLYSSYLERSFYKKFEKSELLTFCQEIYFVAFTNTLLDVNVILQNYKLKLFRSLENNLEILSYELKFKILYNKLKKCEIAKKHIIYANNKIKKGLEDNVEQIFNDLQSIFV